MRHGRYRMGNLDYHVVAKQKYLSMLCPRGHGCSKQSMSENNFGMVEKGRGRSCRRDRENPKRDDVAGHATWGSPVLFP